MKKLMLFIFLNLSIFKINSQVSISQISGILEIDLPTDSSSLYIGAKHLDSLYINGYRNGSNVIIGYQAGDSLKEALSTVVLGAGASTNIIKSRSAVTIGNKAHHNGNYIFSSAVIGDAAAENVEEIRSAVIIGKSAGAESKRIYESVLIGAGAGYQTDVRIENVGVGFNSLYKSTGDSNTAIGWKSGYESTGNTNINIGNKAGYSSPGHSNINIGSHSGTDIEGSGNINIGAGSGVLADGSSNIYIGRNTGNRIIGKDNIIIGQQHGNSDSISNKFIVTGNGGWPIIYADRRSDSTVIYTQKLRVSPTQWRNNSTTSLLIEGDAIVTGRQKVGQLQIFSENHDDTVLQTDTSRSSSDLIFKSNDKVIIDLDSNDDENNSTFSVRNSDGNTIFNLSETGNLSVNGTLVHSSDYNRKYDINKIDNQDILQKISELDINTWKYKETDETHIGPMAQDFYAAFGLGGSDTTIATVDADGVALAAIKALAAENASLKNTIRSIQLELTQIKNQLDEK